MSWYPDTSPPNEEKWKIPSCIPCNSAYGRLEKDFRLRIAMCLDPNDSASQSIVETALRDIQPSAAKSERDRQARIAAGRELLTEMKWGSDIPRNAIYPGLDEKWGRPVEEQVAVTLPVKYMRRMTEKIVRGLFYIEDGKFIEPPYRIRPYTVHEEPARPVRSILDRFARTHSRPPGLIIRRAVAFEDGVSSVFEITFWKQFKSYAAVSQESKS